MTDESTPEVVQCADDAYEAIRSINHLTISTRSGPPVRCGAFRRLPAPLVYQVLGNFKGVGNMQALNQLAAGLGKSLDTHVVYEDDGRGPVQSIAPVTDHLTRAAELAEQLGTELANAQSAISRQGYREK